VARISASAAPAARSLGRLDPDVALLDPSDELLRIVLAEIAGSFRKYDPEQLIARIKQSDVWVEPPK
jgi:hypothetical protein